MWSKDSCPTAAEIMQARTTDQQRPQQLVKRRKPKVPLICPTINNPYMERRFLSNGGRDQDSSLTTDQQKPRQPVKLRYPKITLTFSSINDPYEKPRFRKGTKTRNHTRSYLLTMHVHLAGEEPCRFWTRVQWRI